MFRPLSAFVKTSLVERLRLNLSASTIQLPWLPLEAPVVTRREQLGSDDRSLDANEDQDADFQADAAGEGDLAEGSEPRKKPSAAKAKAQAKAKAKAKGRSKPKAKSEPKLFCKQETARKRKAGKSNEANKHSDSHDLEKPQPEDSQPLEEGNAVEKKPEGDDGEKLGTSKEVEALEAGAKKKPRKSREPRQPGAPLTTFAARYMPQGEVSAIKFTAIRDVFMEFVAPKLKGQTKFQDHLWISAQRFKKQLLAANDT